MTVIDIKPYRERKLAKLRVNPVELSFDMLILQFKFMAFTITASLIVMELTREYLQKVRLNEPKI